jgi:O-antigen biosynthesis protein
MKIKQYYTLAQNAVNIIQTQGWRIFWTKLFRRTKRQFQWYSPDPYHVWINKNEPLNSDLEDQKREVLALKYSPKISLITPVWNPDVRWLILTIESVLKQTYDNWELCLADGASSNPMIRQTLREYAGKDPRIKVKYLKENKGIAGNSNQALSLATGEFIGLLDHDDEIAPFALYEVVKALNNNPVLDFIYSDEDKITTRQKRVEPVFKPDWSPDLLLSCMYTGHLGIYRKDIVYKIIGFKSEFDGSQDYDFVLRFVEKTNNIGHIPKILYHWRTAVGSAAADLNAKSYAYLAAKKALGEYLIRNNIQGGVQYGSRLGSYRITRKIAGNPLISIIIPSKNKAKILRTCVTSIFDKTGYENYEVILVDNQSSEESIINYYKEIGRDPRIKIISYDKPFNYSAVNNYAVSQAQGEYILLLNNDTRTISPDWLSNLLEQAQRPEVGAVGAQLLFPDHSIQHCGVIVGLGQVAGEEVAGHPYAGMHETHGYMGRISMIGNYSAVTAACMMMRRQVYQDIGGFNEELAYAYNDVDLCLRLREKDYLIVYTPYAQLYHLESLTRGREDSKEKLLRFSKEVKYMRTRWAKVLSAGDPYYNPNLSLQKQDFSLKL